MHLHGVAAEEQLLGDLAIAGWRREAAGVAVGAAQCDEDLALGLGQLAEREAFAGRCGLLNGHRARGLVGEYRLADANSIAVAQAVAAADAPAIDIRPVPREPIVDDRP